jgi:2-haloacid dehalogenase
MAYNRRDVLALTAATVAAGISTGTSTGFAAPNQTIKAIAFDGFAIFDPRPALTLGKQLYPDKAEGFVSLFQTRLFEYQWLRTIGRHYKDFFSIIDDAHLFAASQLGMEATEDKRAQLRDAFLNLNAWSDVAAVLQSLKAKGIKLGLLSNMTARMLNAAISNSGLDRMFDHVLINRYISKPTFLDMTTRI